VGDESIRRRSSISRNRAIGTPGATSWTARAIVGASVASGSAVLITTCIVVGVNDAKLMTVSLATWSTST
jgi:hypothetical protein